MAGQGPSRRELIQAMTIAAAASTFGGFARWNFAHAESMAHHEQDSAIKPLVRPVYTPQFFTPSEYRTVDELSELILPAVSVSTASKTTNARAVRQPGARDVGVAEFIDFTVFSEPALQPRFRDGLRWLDQAAAPASSFISLSAEQQHAILNRLAYAKYHRKGEVPGQQFFILMRRYTVMGFYTTREGLE